MIDSKSRDIEWIKSIRAENPRLDMQLIEKTIRAYNIDTAIRDAAKSAYVAAFIGSQESVFNRFDKSRIGDLAHMTIDKRLNTKLNKLKKTNPEAFFYWWQVDNLI